MTVIHALHSLTSSLVELFNVVVEIIHVLIVKLLTQGKVINVIHDLPLKFLTILIFNLHRSNLFLLTATS